MVKPTVISLFAGCGGSSLGYKLAGYKELLAIDFDNNAVETFELNFDSPIWNKDISKVTGKEILEFTKLKKGELDLLDGSPPCQGFSLVGKRKIEDERNDLFNENIRLIKELNPKVFVIENVKGMISGAMKGKFNEIFKDLKAMDYNVKCKLMNSMYYNVAQSRERIIFIGVRKDLKKQPVFPIPSKKIITVNQAFKGVKNKTFQTKHIEIQKELFAYIKPGKKAKDSVPPEILLKYLPRVIKNPRITFGNLCSRIHPNKPARTVMRQGAIYHSASHIHPTENRIITIEELKRLTSFPDDFKFVGSFEQQWARMGNAVMPNFMKAIAETIKKETLQED